MDAARSNNDGQRQHGKAMFYKSIGTTIHGGSFQSIGGSINTYYGSTHNERSGNTKQQTTSNSHNDSSSSSKYFASNQRNIPKPLNPGPMQPPRIQANRNNTSVLATDIAGSLAQLSLEDDSSDDSTESGDTDEEWRRMQERKAANRARAKASTYASHRFRKASSQVSGLTSVSERRAGNERAHETLPTSHLKYSPRNPFAQLSMEGEGQPSGTTKETRTWDEVYGEDSDTRHTSKFQASNTPR
ncbi:hypothetical protein H0H92_006275 [Tricholoma furcatifolium]|nr:hypothetical protein H0H92_006275 [Tricholoma furcatifolium]